MIARVAVLAAVLVALVVVANVAAVVARVAPWPAVGVVAAGVLAVVLAGDSVARRWAR